MIARCSVVCIEWIESQVLVRHAGWWRGKNFADAEGSGGPLAPQDIRLMFCKTAASIVEMRPGVVEWRGRSLQHATANTINSIVG